MYIPELLKHFHDCNILRDKETKLTGEGCAEPKTDVCPSYSSSSGDMTEICSRQDK